MTWFRGLSRTTMPSAAPAAVSPPRSTPWSTIGCDPSRCAWVPGQGGDNPQLVPLLHDWANGHGRSRIHLLADKAYSHPSTRQELRRQRIRHTIPERSDQTQLRTGKGSRGGRPPSFDPDRYAERNTIERAFGRMKQWRGVASRYDKYALTYLGGVLLAATLQYRQ